MATLLLTLCAVGFGIVCCPTQMHFGSSPHGSHGHLFAWMSAPALLILLLLLGTPRCTSSSALANSSEATSAAADSSLDCFYCRHSNRERDVLDRVDQHPECLSFELFANQSQFRRACTSAEPFCMTTVTSLNGFFADMRRDCVERCRPGCQESGYGIFVRTCTRCCQSRFCNHFDGKKFLLNDLDVQQLGGTTPNGTKSQFFGESVLIESAAESATGTGIMLWLFIPFSFSIFFPFTSIHKIA